MRGGCYGFWPLLVLYSVVVCTFSMMFLVFLAADPKGTVSCSIQGESVRTSVHLFVCPSVRSSVYLSVCLFLPPSSQPATVGLWADSWTDRWTDRWTDKQIDRQTHRFPCILQGIFPFWIRCPAYFETAIAMLMVRARVPLTIYCLWATGL